MTYRRLSLIFAVFVLHGATTQVYTAAHDPIEMMDEWMEVDGKVITRRGVINEIAEALEGVAHITEDVLNILLAPLKQLIKLDQQAVVQNPHKKDVARVRMGNPICQGEMEFREQRLPVVKAAQERFLGLSLEDDEVLEIGFSGSGGGMRAKTYFLGVCVGADKIGLLDTAMCMSGLSGGTWFLGPWVSSGLNIQDYREEAIQDCLEGMDLQDVKDLGPILDSLWVKFAFNQPLNIVDGYGALLGNNFLRGFDKKQNMIYISEQSILISDGAYPMPVYTAVLGERDMPNHWFEFTPFEVGSRWLGAYVPTWAFGQKFKKGESKSSAPEMSLGFNMGIFGSAFAASFSEAYEKAIKDAALPKFLRGVPLADKIWASMKQVVAQVVAGDIGNTRLAWAEVFNYAYKLKQSPFSQYRDLKLADGGVDFNNPIFATYRKPPYGQAPDVVFVFDSGSTVNIDDLKIAEQYAQKHNLKFPKIDREDVDQRALTVFEDPSDPEMPLVIYMPRVVNQELLERYAFDPVLADYVARLKSFDVEEEIATGFAHTINFKYTKEQAELIADLAEFNVRACEDDIRELLQKRVEAKRALKVKRGFKPKRIHQVR